MVKSILGFTIEQGDIRVAFKAGFDCRDRLDNEAKNEIEMNVISGHESAIKELMDKNTQANEALKIAVEALEFYADGESWSTIDHSKRPTTYDRLEYDKDLGVGDFQITEDTDDSNVSGLRARKSLAEISKLRGEG